MSHPSVVSDSELAKVDTKVVQIEHFLCADAVDVTMLLRAVRAALLERVKICGADSLVDEGWTCKIRGPKNKVYRAHIEYTAHPAHTGRADPGRPVVPQKARGVSGLMTILERS